jgi:hypothetical protein
MSRLLPWVCCLALAGMLLAGSAHALVDANSGGGGTSATNSPATSGDAEDSADSAFPQLWPEGTLETQYAELGGGPGQPVGLLTVLCSEDAYLALLCYPSQTPASIVLSQLPLPAHELVTLTYALPSGRELRSRLIASREILTNGELKALQQESYPTGKHYPAVGAEAWFNRAAQTVVRLPWENPFRLSASPPAAFATERWPLARAEMGADGTVRSKDCCIAFSGLTAVGFDDYGSFGRWQLGWGNDLTLLLELPRDFHPGQAQLLIRGEPASGALYGGLPSLTLNVNGWHLAGTDVVRGLGSGMQPVGASLSPYLQPGLNAIVLSLDAFADTQVYIDVLELWAR